MPAAKVRGTAGLAAALTAGAGGMPVVGQQLVISRPHAGLHAATCDPAAAAALPQQAGHAR